MALVFGINAKLYIDDESSYAAPSWSEVTNCQDVTLNLEISEADVTTRGATWKKNAGVLKDASVEFTMVWDTTDANFTSIKDAFINGTAINMAVMDGDVQTAGSQGLRSPMMISKFTRNEKMTEALTVNVTAKPTYYSGDEPEWLEVS